jgi:predicted heme/steroid binding protein
VTKRIAAATLVSLILGFAMIGGAVYWQLESAKGSDVAGADVGTEPANRSYTVEELAQYDGKDDNQCLVAVDGDVYLIEGFALWQMGEHLPSGGRARCGLDLTEVIDESPHGRSKLQLLKKVGTLE